jgi:hypothetical protein
MSSLERVGAVTSLAVVLLLHPMVARSACDTYTATINKPGITLVGHTNGVLDPRGEITVRVTDGSTPCQGKPVYIYFKSPINPTCDCPDIQLCPSPLDPFIGDFECTPFSVRVMKWTDSFGQATFNLVGRSTNTGVSPGHQAPCAVIKVGSSYTVATVTVATLDQNGGGITASDITLCKADFNSGQYFGRSDYNFSGTLTSADITLIKAAFNAGQSPQGCSSTYCP